LLVRVVGDDGEHVQRVDHQVVEDEVFGEGKRLLELGPCEVRITPRIQDATVFERNANHEFGVIGHDRPEQLSGLFKAALQTERSCDLRQKNVAVDPLRRVGCDSKSELARIRIVVIPEGVDVRLVRSS
jgi:hypothetical protein